MGGAPFVQVIPQEEIEAQTSEPISTAGTTTVPTPPSTTSNSEGEGQFEINGEIYIGEFVLDENNMLTFEYVDDTGAFQILDNVE